MRVGILGAGQLGRMLAIRGYPLGMRFRFLDRAPDAPAADLGEMVTADFTDFNALARFAKELDVVTWEFENVPVAAAEFLAQRVPVHPPPRALAVAQDRLEEKRFFESLGIPVPPFRAVDDRAALDDAIREIGTPAILKTRRLGYDGKGQFTLHSPGDAEAAFAALGAVPLILERRVPFRRELSILAARSRSGDVVCYPLVENTHEQGILRLSRAPAHAADALQQQAAAYITAALEELDYVGVLAIELFEHDGRLLASEMAPRVHNSGHWSMEGAVACQFENHLRAIAGYPLGSTAPTGHCAMLNVIGGMPDTAKLLAVPGAHVHLYGKEQRPGRKLGHVTVWATDAADVDRRLEQIEAIVDAHRA
jgi:5-(carboxyamino)imidazole ribonucleotide synthase